MSAENNKQPASQSLPAEQLDQIIDLALAEDTGRGDITSKILLPAEISGQASLLAKAEGILAGVEVAERVFYKVDPSINFETLIQDGNALKPGDIIANISGNVISILKAERTVLNFLQRLSGIASLTARYIAEVQGFNAKITDTRKTTPGLRLLEKYAVRTGGGCNHRSDLSECVLIKDNHLAILRAMGMNFQEIIEKAKKNAPMGMMIEVEVTNAREAMEALKAGVTRIMLDNMSPDEMRRVVKLIGGKAETEASGGINLSNVRQVAMTGVDIISIGALTHSPRALDISLEIESQKMKLI